MCGDPKFSDSFDRTYEEDQDMFGHPYRELQDYFKNCPVKGKLLDLGCGQGRDSLFLASLGYDVTAVDSSKVGVDQMMNISKERGINVEGIVENVLDLKLNKEFEVILFDMILHSFGKSKQKYLLRKYAAFLKKKGILCIVFPDDMKTDYFMGMLNSLKCHWKLLEEVRILDVPNIEGESGDLAFMMMVVQLS
ncbi:methyltransferase domain-containing protein [Candidatus Woesearchaeota archaeon]|nr:methyltransferase domain-containing protein [Candidatus Woesearchaeota archaeon]